MRPNRPNRPRIAPEFPSDPRATKPEPRLAAIVYGIWVEYTLNGWIGRGGPDVTGLSRSLLIFFERRLLV